jgi:hypothetical protein
MDEHPEERGADAAETADALEKADPPRPVRGLRWVFIPTVIGAAVGAAWSAYYAAAQHFDPATPIGVGGAVGLGIGAFLWVAFPYKASPRKRPSAPKEARHD